jgi:hypothetical protein
MRAFIYFCVFTITSAFEELGAQAPNLKRSEKDVAAVTKYLIATHEGKAVEFPLDLKNKDVFVYTFMSGTHKVRPRGDDSTLLIVLSAKDGPEGPRGVFFQFTVEPKLSPQELAKKEKNWKLILSDRKVTQYHVCEFPSRDGKSRYKDLHLVTKPRK